MKMTKSLILLHHPHRGPLRAFIASKVPRSHLCIGYLEISSPRASMEVIFKASSY
jgi:hypothetical protein